MLFWTSKKRILEVKEKFLSRNIRLGRGLIFHICPSNVPTNFAYSMIFGLLSGNNNIIRLPSKNFFQVKIITKFLKKRFGGEEIEKGDRIFLKNSKEIYSGKEIGELAEECDAKFDTKSVISIELADVTQDDLKKWGYPDSKLLPIPGK